MTRVEALVKDRDDFYSLSAEATAQEAALYLRDRGVRATVVCDGEKHAIGVISRSDISDKVSAEHLCPSWVKVREIMTTKLICVTPDSSIEECLQLMDKNDIYHVLVVDPEGISLGMISEHDILRSVATDQRARADLLEHWAFPSA